MQCISETVDIVLFNKVFKNKLLFKKIFGFIRYNYAINTNLSIVYPFPESQQHLLLCKLEHLPTLKIPFKVGWRFLNGVTDYYYFRRFYDLSPDHIMEIQKFYQVTKPKLISNTSPTPEALRNINIKDYANGKKLIKKRLLVDAMARNKGNVKIIEFLISRGFFYTKIGLLNAILSQNIPVARLFASKFRDFLRQNSKELVEVLVSFGSLESLKFMYNELKVVPNTIQAPLIYHALDGNDYEMVKFLNENNIGQKYKPYEPRHINPKIYIHASIDPRVTKALKYHTVYTEYTIGDLRPTSGKRRKKTIQVMTYPVSYTYYRLLQSITHPRILKYLQEHLGQEYTWISVLNAVKLEQIENLKYFLSDHRYLFYHQSMVYSKYLSEQYPQSYKFLYENRLYYKYKEFTVPYIEKSLEFNAITLNKKRINHGMFLYYLCRNMIPSPYEYQNEPILASHLIRLTDYRTGAYHLLNYSDGFKFTFTEMFKLGMALKDANYLRIVFEKESKHNQKHKTNDKSFQVQWLIDSLSFGNIQIFKFLLDKIDRINFGTLKTHHFQRYPCSMECIKYLMSMQLIDNRFKFNPTNNEMSMTFRFRESKKPIGKNENGKRLYMQPRTIAIYITLQCPVSICTSPLEMILYSILHDINFCKSTDLYIMNLVQNNNIAGLLSIGQHMQLFSPVIVPLNQLIISILLGDQHTSNRLIKCMSIENIKAASQFLLQNGYIRESIPLLSVVLVKSKQFNIFIYLNYRAALNLIKLDIINNLLSNNTSQSGGDDNTDFNWIPNSNKTKFKIIKFYIDNKILVTKDAIEFLVKFMNENNLSNNDDYNEYQTMISNQIHQ
ncbi:hypothetical protein DLAC_11278 [Tieghemostelium lacteum]|uniref:Ankyrin repeat-containing protein n=1 Tax=Tieghemostelium lacteum TaxID=361077 RepID=A0A151Z3M5_TIELA|nr:hypothetical protein DLAC_11278 [Tieghemostelium lacteum]|eukprot:KYQ88551.1 hypothetical protein DLAC_11278 [Tieghemostelium lacteum]